METNRQGWPLRAGLYWVEGVTGGRRVKGLATMDYWDDDHVWLKNIDGLWSLFSNYSSHGVMRVERVSSDMLGEFLEGWE